MSERPISFVVSDVDATQVIPGRHSILTPAVERAAHELRANGIPLLEATSRSHALMTKLIKPLDLRDNLCTLDGGATVAHADSGKVVWSRWLKGEVVRDVVSSVGSFCTRIHYDIASRDKTPAEVMKEVRDPKLLRRGAPAVFAIFEVGRTADVLSALGRLSGIRRDIEVMSYNDKPHMRCVQVVAPKIDKGYGMQQMLRRARLHNARGLIIGDNTNDLALFAAAGPDSTKVAMGNACRQLKEQADHVTDHVKDDGFAQALRHYKLIR